MTPSSRQTSARRPLAVAFALVQADRRRILTTLWVAALIFVVLPTLFTAVYFGAPQEYAENTHQLVPGFFALTYLVLGWVFAAGIGALATHASLWADRSRCINAYPVKKTHALLTQFAAGALTMLACFAAVLFAEVAMNVLADYRPVSAAIVRDALLVGIALSAASYAIATAATALTGSASAGMIGAAVLLLAAIALPLLVPAVGGQPLWVGASLQSLRTETTGFICVAGLLITLLGVFISVWACRADRPRVQVPRGYGALALAIPMTVLILGLHELETDNYPAKTRWLDASVGKAIYLCSLGRHRIAAICEKSDGDISRTAQLAVWTLSPDGLVEPPAIIDVRRQRNSYGLFPLFDEKDNLYVVEKERTRYPYFVGQAERTTPRLSRFMLHVAGVDLENKTIGTDYTLDIPTAIENYRDIDIYDFLVARGLVIAVYAVRPETDMRLPVQLYLSVYALDAGRQPALVSCEKFGEPVGGSDLRRCFKRAADGGLAIHRDGHVWIMEFTQQPEWPVRIHGAASGDAVTYEAYQVLDDEFAAVADRAGLRIVRTHERDGGTAHSDDTPVARLDAGLAAWPFRIDKPRVLSSGPGLVWEVHSRRVGLIDTHSPTQPRRQLWLRTYPSRGAVANDEFLFIRHEGGFTLIPTPR